MARILKREPLLDGRDADNLEYINSVDEAYKPITEFETGSTTKFSCLKEDKGFGNTGVSSKYNIFFLVGFSFLLFFSLRVWSPFI